MHRFRLGAFVLLLFAGCRAAATPPGSPGAAGPHSPAVVAQKPPAVANQECDAAARDWARADATAQRTPGESQELPPRLRQELQASLDSASRCIAQAPARGDVHLMRAKAHFLLGQTSEGFRDAAKALELIPQNDEALAFRAIQWISEKNWEGAAEIHRRLDERDSPHAREVAVALMLAQAEAATADWDPEAEPWRAVEIPRQDGIVTIFEQRRIHPVQAEYSRRVRIQIGKVGPRTVDLPVNTGGRTSINVYWVKRDRSAGPWLRLVDAWGESMVSLQHPRLERICRREGRAHRILSEGCSWWQDARNQWRPGGEERPLPRTYPGRYLGVIDGRTAQLSFVSSERAPEQAIEPHLQE